MKITIIGAGNVASHLAVALFRAKYDIVQVYSRTNKHAAFLAKKVDAQPVSEIEAIESNADLYIIALKDDIIVDIVRSLHLPGKIVVHTSGSSSMSALASVSERIGVFYPLQTFSKEKEMSFSEVPVFIEGCDKGTTVILNQFAHTISNHVYEADSAKRKAIHIAAVIACNFTNYLYQVSSDYLSEHGISFDVLKPLIRETAQKIMETEPVNAQTGPAARGDWRIIEDHLKILENKPELMRLYQLLSEGIASQHK